MNNTFSVKLNSEEVKCLSLPTLSLEQRFVKRLFDLVLATALFLLLSPSLLLIALLIRLDSPGAPIYRHYRIGEGGKLFLMYKFRSMINGAEEMEGDLIQWSENKQMTFAKSPADARITRLGRFIRRTSLDELPQLINVIKGEMSLVGPRPELPRLFERYQPEHYQRFNVPQGMTGWWQINGRMNRPGVEQRAEDDCFYIKNYSFYLDLKILWRTLAVVIRGEGAY